jgi:hypothetical protein
MFDHLSVQSDCLFPALCTESLQGLAGAACLGACAGNECPVHCTRPPPKHTYTCSVSTHSHCVCGCVSCVQGACKGWRALREWVSADGSLDLMHLRQLAGHCSVCATNTAR